MEGSRVAVTVDGERVTGTVVEATYTVKSGSPVVAVAFDEPRPDGREQVVVPLSKVDAI